MSFESWIALASLIVTIIVAVCAGVWSLLQNKAATEKAGETVRETVGKLSLSIDHLTETVRDLRTSHLAAVTKLDSHGERIIRIEGRLDAVERIVRESE